MAYFGGDTQQIVAELGEVKPTYLPSVPRIFEKIYTLATASLSPEDKAQLDQAVALGVKVRDLQAHGQEVPEELKAPFDGGRRSACSPTCARSSAATCARR